MLKAWDNRVDVAVVELIEVTALIGNKPVSIGYEYLVSANGQLLQSIWISRKVPIKSVVGDYLARLECCVLSFCCRDPLLPGRLPSSCEVGAYQ